jgi:hypothetical protein
MVSCDMNEERFLDDLYGLLEPAESRALHQHADGCPACAAARARARRVQGKLAAAARVTFPAVRFQAPRNPVVTPAEPAALPLRRLWVRWAVAAALLLAAGGLLAPVVRHIAASLDAQAQLSRAREHRDTLAEQERQTADDFNGRFTRLVAARDAAGQRQRDLQALHDERTDQVRRQPYDLVVTGPETLQPGGYNEFRVVTLNDRNAPVSSRVRYTVLDREGRSVYASPEIDNTDSQPIVLPPTLPLTPDNDLSLEVVAVTEGGPRAELRERLPLARPVYVTHLATDKPLYQPGETVYFRSLTLDRASLRPPADDLELVFTVLDPHNAQLYRLEGRDLLQRPAEAGRPAETVTGPDGKPLRGVGSGAYPLPPTAPGGEYTLRVEDRKNRFPPEVRKFLVNRYQPAKLDKELKLDRRSYGPGDVVTVLCTVKRAGQSEPLAGAAVTASAQVDNKPVPVTLSGPTTDARGAVEVRLTLPGTIDRGDATVTVAFKAGEEESVSRPIPVALKKLKLLFFPEGGELVAGLEGRVYFQALTTLDRPAELTGHVVDDTGKTVVASVTTLQDDREPGVNQGQGVFTLTPEKGRTYRLVIDTPQGIEGDHYLRADKEGKPLPADETGVALRVPDGVTADPQPIRVTVGSAGKDRKLVVGAYCRGRVLAQESVTVAAGKWAEVALKPAAGLGGVTRVTVFEDTGAADRPLRERAERLVYRKPVDSLRLAVRPDRSRYSPADPVGLTLSAADAQGKPRAAVVMVGVVNQSVVAMADEKSARAMPTHLLLTSEVRRPEDLEYADVLLGPGPQAAAALDLLLGTQGWRHFIEQQPSRQLQDPDARRVVTLNVGPNVRTVSKKTAQLQQIEAELRPQMAQAGEALTKSAAEVEELAKTKPAVQATLQQLTKDVAAADRDYQNALAAVHGYEDRRRTFAAVLLAVVLVVLLAVTAVGLSRALLRQRRVAVSLYAVLAGGVGVCALLLAVALGSGTESAGTGDGGKQVALADTGPAVGRPAPPPAFGPGHMVPAWAGPGGPMRIQTAPMIGRGAPDAGAPARGIPGRPVRPLVAMPNAVAGPGVQAKATPPAEPQPLTVREYAHLTKREDRAGAPREDFTETVFWQPALVLPEGGETTVRFHLSDEVTRWRVVVAGHTLDGLIGEQTSYLEARQALAVDAKLPQELTAGDKLDLPVTLGNDTDQPQSVRLAVETKGGRLVVGPANLPGNKTTGLELVNLPVGPREHVRRLFRLEPTVTEGRLELTLDAREEPPVRDTVKRSIAVVPDGFPIAGSHSDVLEKVARQQIALPPTWIKGTLQAGVEVYPSTLADLQKGLEGLLSEPHGCFEQTSTANYPNVLVLDYLRESRQADPAVAEKARELLRKGYRQLTKFECDKVQGDGKQGYEWFGGKAAPHEALTAYGLMEFRDMARVFEGVDPAMMERTRQYLLSCRDGKGGFTRNPRALDHFGHAPDHVTNAYIVWALTESDRDGKDDLAKELAALTEQAKNSVDPYFLALVANGQLNRGQTGPAVELLRKLVGLQAKDGSLEGTSTSITGSAGRDLRIETTALAVLAWLKANQPGAFNPAVQSAVRWIGQQRGGHGAFGSTQSTILALKALIAFTQANKQTAEAGELSVYVGDRLVGKKAFPAGARDVIGVDIPNAEALLKPGANEVRVEITGKNQFPYTLSWSYRSQQPASAADCAVKLSTKLSKAEAAEGESVRLTAAVANVSGKGQGMAVAVIGLPAGLQVPVDQKELIQLRDRGDVSAYELLGRAVVLYWRDLAPGKTIEVSFDLLGHVPGEFRGPASRAYLYYNSDAKSWAEPLVVKIAAGR